MAVWQFTFDLIPAAYASAGQLSEEELNTVKPDLSGDQIATLFDVLDGMLPRAASWNENLHIWGQSKADDVQIWLREGVVEVQFRLNALEPSAALVDRFSALAAQFDGVFADRDGHVIAPTPEALGEAFRHSRAARFAQGPEAFLRGLGDGEIAPPKTPTYRPE